LLKKYIGKSVQKYPNFSSKPINGTPLFQLARDSGLEGVEIPEHEVEIFNAEFLGRREVDKEELLKNIEDKINLVKGDFRQEEILKTWQEVLGPKDNSNTDSVQETKFIIDKIKMKVSSGFYIRQFVSDLSKELNFPAVTFHIKRTSVGDFSF
jgi:tRNA U55 pseudouridine synthase TruB